MNSDETFSESEEDVSFFRDEANEKIVNNDIVEKAEVEVFNELGKPVNLVVNSKKNKQWSNGKIFILF